MMRCRPSARLAVWVATLSCAAGALRADVATSLAPAASAVDGEVRFDLLLLNDDATTSAAFDVPGTLPCRLTTPDGAVDATATRVDAPGEPTLRLAAGGFARVGYAVKLRTVGRVVIELTDRPAATVVTIAPLAGAAVGGSEARPAKAGLAGGQGFPRNPLEVVTQRDPNFRSELGLVEYLGYRIKPHEPVYIVAGDEEPSTKFQLSFKYQVFDPNGPVAQKVPALGGLYFGYTQTSLWDFGDESSPFFDTSYKPEAMVSYDNLDRFLRDEDAGRGLPDWLKLGFQAGLRHESNGQSGGDSRSYNIVYARPIVTFSGRDGLFLSLAPTVFGYVFDLGDNPDIADYRGHAELRVVAGQGGGLQLAATGRLGDGLDDGSLELDLSFPLRRLSLGNLDVYFYSQYFTGYGETLRTYDEKSHALRFGIALVR